MQDRVISIHHSFLPPLRRAPYARAPRSRVKLIGATALACRPRRGGRSSSRTSTSPADSTPDMVALGRDVGAASSPRPSASMRASRPRRRQPYGHLLSLTSGRGVKRSCGAPPVRPPTRPWLWLSRWAPSAPNVSRSAQVSRERPARRVL